MRPTLPRPEALEAGRAMPLDRERRTATVRAMATMRATSTDMIKAIMITATLRR